MDLCQHISWLIGKIRDRDSNDFLGRASLSSVLGGGNNNVVVAGRTSVEAANGENIYCVLLVIATNIWSVHFTCPR